MTQHDLLDALVQVQRMGNLLNEVMDISRQLAEAVDRQDQVTIRMLISMRQEPIAKLQQADRALRTQCGTMAVPEDGRRLADLLAGAAPAPGTGEEGLASRVAANSRLLQQVIAIDKAVSFKMARDKSVYQR